jgi:hypothetical protein
MYRKDEKYYCRNCYDLILVFSRDVVFGEAFTTDAVYPDEGQCPKPGQRTKCAECEFEYGEELKKGII